MSTASEVRGSAREVADLPSPRGVPILGNALQLKPARAHLILEEWARELGTPYRFQICSTSLTVWDDSELLQSILRERPYGYRRYSTIESTIAEMGSCGLFSAEGEAWAPQRKLVMQAMTASHIKAFYPKMALITERLRLRWQRAAQNHQVIEMNDDLKRYTVDVTSALAFGEDPNTLEQDGNVIQEHLKLIFPMIMSRINAPFPYWRYVELPRDRRLSRALVEVHRYVRTLMARARERNRDRPHQEPENLLDAMLQIRDAPGSDITDDDIAGNVLTMLLAGEDTTAHSIAWAMLYLGTDQALQRRVADVSLRVLGEGGVCPSYEALKGLDLCEAVCTEASRFRPVVAVHAIESLKEAEHHGIRMPAGSKMFFLTRPAMLDSKKFEHPERFNPERWMHDRTPGRGAHETRAYLQFGAGPRVCPGRHLSTVEMRLVISMLSASFFARLAVDPNSIQEVSAFTMVPNTMPMRLEMRPA
jgi:cytochrome P450